MIKLAWWFACLMLSLGLWALIIWAVREAI